MPRLFRITRSKSLCPTCPLDGYCTKVRGESAREDPKIALIGEAPGKDEDESGHPFIGKAGEELNRVLAKAGLYRQNAYVMNLINCRPPDNDLSSSEGTEALIACRPGFEEELKELHRRGVRAIVALGGEAAHALGIEGAIHKVRGSVYEVVIQGLHFWVVPTFHPSYIIRGQWSQEPTMINDVEKAIGIAVNGYTPPEEDFLLFPTVADIELRAKDLVQRKPLIGVDIETTGLNYYDSEIFVLAIATSGVEAFSIPFYSQGFVPYWKNGHLVRVQNALYDILGNCPTLFQNAPFDVQHLEHHGYAVKTIAHDVLLLHHAVHPELPHNLGYIVSIYGATPYWKDIKLRFPRMRQTPDDELRTYNARDAVVLHQVLPSLLKDLKETGTENIYFHYSLRLIRPVLALQRNGMLLDQGRLRAWKKDLEKRLTVGEKILRLKGKLPEDFNLASPHHLTYWLYGKRPLTYEAWKTELASYDEEGSRKKKNTKKYEELSRKVSFYNDVTPLAMSKSKVRKTKKGFSKDEKALLLIKLAAVTELETIEKFRRPTAEHLKRCEELRLLRDVLVIFQQRQKIAKLLSTYTKYDVGPDMRVHPSFKIHGTATGRLSSGEGENEESLA